MKGTRSGGSKGTPRSKKKAVAPPTLSEWEMALKEAASSASPGEGVTVSELVERTGDVRSTIVSHLKRLIRSGVVQPTTHGKRATAMTGRGCRVPSYIWVKKS